ncbi:serine hydrolase domain-containing protein [Actinophytocola sp.]|uniref:serine hydrolase domain-containing protein n=1 Tax=Actinophytocola sp. TaxID=1872138 RepID=UPI002ED115D6
MVNGSCAPAFARVREEFERNFAERGEIGASVCVLVDGEPVVDLWGGVVERGGDRPWEEDTVSVVFSTTKGVTALCAHILASRGQLDLAAPVATYWPEFAKSGKEGVTVGMLLSHRAGVPVVTTPLADGAFFDWDGMVAALEAEPPVWEPGSRHGYHAFTFGWLVGEVVRRVSGQSLGQFVRAEIAEPLGLDLWLGLPEDVEPRVATMGPADPRPDDEPSKLSVVAATEPQSLQGQLMLNTGGYLMGAFNSRAAHVAEMGAVGAITNARAIAGMYAPLACGGALGGVRLVDAAALARMSTTVSAGQDAVAFANSRYTYGFVPSIDNRHEPPGLRDSMILSADAFGHPGLGGGVGFASPANRLSFGYTMNAMGPGTLLNDRGQALVDAVYTALGYTDSDAEIWRR